MTRRNVAIQPTGPMIVFWLIGKVVQVMARFIAGRPLNGVRKTDATFLRAGTTQFDKQARVRPGHYRPEWQRAAIRLGVMFGVLVEGAGLARHHTLTVTLNIVAVVVLAVVAVMRVRRWWLTRKLRREVIRPLELALTHRLSIAPGTRTETWLTIPRDYRSNPDHPVVISLPAGFDRESQGAGVESTALDRLRIAEPIVAWHNYGEHPTVTIKARHAPPDKVLLAHVRKAIDASSETDIVLGIGMGGKIVSASIKLDSPHVALSAPSQAGKSVAAANFLVQQLRHGAVSVIFDIRAESHTWAFNLPNVVVLTTPEQIHAGLLAVWEIARARQQEVKEAGKAGLPRPEYHRLWVVLEELNMTRSALKQLWDSYRADDPERAKRIPKTSPALLAMANVSFAGRSVQVHGIWVAQRLTASATGDNTGAVRENMGIRYMIKVREGTWKMLADGAVLPKFLKGTPGRAHVVINGHVEEVQGVLLTEEELQELALEGVVSPMFPVFRELDQGATFMELSGHVTTAGDLQLDGVSGGSGGHALPAAPETPPESIEKPENEPTVREYLTLEEAVSAGVVAGSADNLAGSVENLKRYLRRDATKGKNVPAAHVIDGARKYDRAELVAWRPNADPESQAG
jgi:hypothetical protein